jgi:4-alpha-glucanotransferase
VIGDIPIYVSGDSCDVWANRSLFQTNKDGSFKSVAGVPPDYFCEDGQLWGNPVYDWAAHEKEDYAWWLSRLHQNFKLYDVIRIDHFRGFSRYYSCPADAENARNGKWNPGPGMKLWNKIFDEFGKEPPIFAEDLGETDDELIRFLDETGLPTMRVLQFGMVPHDDSKHMPHNYPENCIAYTGTHDNNTLLGWLWEAPEDERRECLKYCGFEGDNWGDGGVRSASCRAIIKTLWMSPANTVIIPIQDMLGYGGDTRMNIPGTPEGNWRVRFSKEDLDSIDNDWYKELNRLYRRW